MRAIWVMLVVGLGVAVGGVYTNADALECFNSKAIRECSKEFEGCLADEACVAEL
jgi:hypothetical protein